MNVLDISKHQGTFDPIVAKKNGIEAVVVRLAYGAAKDATAVSWVKSIHNAGLPVWGYGFATWHYYSVNGGSIAAARSHMRTQATAWCNAAKNAGITGYIAIDQELENGQRMPFDMTHNTTLLNECAAIIRQAGFKPLIYCSVAWDYERICTADLMPDINYWFAYYPTSVRSKDFKDVSMKDVPTGKYGNWLQRCYTNGRLAGWQYGSTGCGNQYGCGSANVDRNLWYISPDDGKQGKSDLHAVHTAEMSKGDLAAVKAVLDARQIQYEVL